MFLPLTPVRNAATGMYSRVLVRCLRAGVGVKLWPYAVKHWCFAENTHDYGGGTVLTASALECGQKLSAFPSELLLTLYLRISCRSNCRNLGRKVSPACLWAIVRTQAESGQEIIEFRRSVTGTLLNLPRAMSESFPSNRSHALVVIGDFQCASIWMPKSAKYRLRNLI